MTNLVLFTYEQVVAVLIKSRAVWRCFWM